jgi:hypothetical protein
MRSYHRLLGFPQPRGDGASNILALFLEGLSCDAFARAVTPDQAHLGRKVIPSHVHDKQTCHIYALLKKFHP